MQYMLLIYTPEPPADEQIPTDVLQAQLAAYDAFT